MRVQIFFERLYVQDNTIISCDSTEIDEIIKSSYIFKSIPLSDLDIKFYSYSEYPGVYDIHTTFPKIPNKYIGTIFYEDSAFFNMPIFQSYVRSSINDRTIDRDTFSKYLIFSEDYSWRSGKRILQLPHT